MPQPLLELRQIEKSYAGVRALRGVSFDLQPGEVHALLGENGAGKSTLVKVITGAVEPDAGAIILGDRELARLTPAGAHALGIACIYQQPALFPELSVAENLALRLEPARGLRRVDWKARRATAAALLARIGAPIPPDAAVRTLSMPEQQLVEIACALGAGARIVIMDEPTAALTQREQELLFKVIAELRADGVGIIYISHRLDEIFRLADRVTVLRDGESVGTCAANAIDEAGLIKLMVGREVSQIYPPGHAHPGAPVLTLSGIGCTASGVRGVSLEIRAGEVLGLSGLVGAGRTELAHILFGLTPADAGTIAGATGPVAIRSPQDALALGIAYVPEDRRRHGLILEMPIAHNATLAIHRRIFPHGFLRDRAERELTLEYMRQLSVKAAGPEAKGGSLSGGNQQKIALARWLATKPRLLILDEPTQGIDVGAKSEIHRLIRQLTAEGIAVLLISSDLPEVLGMSDRIAVMRGGALVATLPGGTAAHTVMAAALGQSGKGEAA